MVFVHDQQIYTVRKFWSKCDVYFGIMFLPWDFLNHEKLCIEEEHCLYQYNS